MQKLVQGVHRFQNTVFETHKALFERLSQGQSPETLFITCSDSRINPNMITQTEPGELFIIRNAGNIVPPYLAGAATPGGETATVEYAVSVLNVKDIIICGHSLCGAMSALLEKEKLADLPAVSAWLDHAEATRRIVQDKYSHLEGEALIMATIEENVLTQLENLCTHPTVASRLAQRTLRLHGWVYKIQSGEVFAYNPAQSQFMPMHEAYPISWRSVRQPQAALEA